MKLIFLTIFTITYGCSSTVPTAIVLPTKENRLIFLGIMDNKLGETKPFLRAIDRCAKDYTDLYLFDAPVTDIIADFCADVLFEFAEITEDFKEKSDQFYTDLINIKNKRQITDEGLAEIAATKAEYNYNQARQAYLFKHNRALAQQHFNTSDPVYHWYLVVLEMAYSKHYYSSTYNHLFQRDIDSRDLKWSKNDIELRLYEGCIDELAAKQKAMLKGLRGLKNRCEILKHKWEAHIEINRRIAEETDSKDFTLADKYKHLDKGE